ncbi:MAG: TetR/AcrR family transcriptional regulator [Bacteroidota bacterium]
MLSNVNTEQKILDAAKKIFEAAGYGGARMQQIADEAGISKASLHYYFRSKENLFERIFHETMDEFMKVLSTWDDNTEDWEFKLREFIAIFFTFLRTNSLLFILRELNRNPDLMIHKAKKKKIGFMAYFERLQEKGILKDTDLNLMYIFLHSLCCYPLINKVIFKKVLKADDASYDAFLETYPKHVADFLILSIKHSNKKTK